MSTIEEIWRGYDKRVIPAECDPIQRAVMRQSFWAGAAAMFSVVTSAGDGTEDEGFATMKALQAELKAYMANMGKPPEANH